MKSKQLLYKKEMIRHLYFGGILSCAELSELTEKSLPLTSKILNELLENEVVQETGLANSTGGRRPQTYQLAAEIMFVVAVAMDQYITRIAVLDMHNNYVTGIEEYPLKLAGNKYALESLGDLIEDFILRSGIPTEKIMGIGIGMPGFVDVNKGINHSFLQTGNLSITSYLQKVTGLPVFIDNDSSVIALAESRFGAGRDHKNVMVVNVSWGIGLGMILDKNLYRGESGFAGEFSHIPIFTNNKICSCGKIGCLETEASLVVLIKKAIEGINSGRSTSLHDLSLDHTASSASAIIKSASEGDKFAIELISEIGYNIGRGIAILIHILNPGIIVLSGRGASAGNLWQAPIQQVINENCIPKISENTRVEISTMGNHAELIGAASLVIEHIEELEVKTNNTHLANVLT
jgi:predicted NBD/HSP70 family sugar kinase